jgi:transcriptional regulator with XRE-family HTH domain
VSLATKTSSGVEMKAHYVNMEIGKRLKRQRKNHKISRKQLAILLNITPQQIQKYEAGINAIPIFRLRQIIIYLDADPKYFLVLK